MIRILTEYSPDALECSLNELISSNPGSRIVGISSRYAQDPRDSSIYTEYVAAVEKCQPQQWHSGNCPGD